ncbi:MAG: PAS domain S-box protein [Ignavibacteria bacterium]
MNPKNDILRIVNNSIKSPALIIDKDGAIVSYNNSAMSIIQPDSFSGSFINLFRNGTAKQIEKILFDCMNQDKTVTELMELEILDNPPHIYDIVFTPFLDHEDNYFILVTLNQAETGELKSGKFRLGLSTKDLNELLDNSAALKVLEEIKSSYPFTFLGKNKIQNEINKLDEAFWLKDNEGKYILVNLKFSRLLGLRPVQIIGRFEREFLPGHLTEFYKALNLFIENTSNIIIKEGIPFPQTSDIDNLRVFEFPLTDLDNKVIAIIGITQNGLPLLNQHPQTENPPAMEVFAQFNYPLLVLDKSVCLKYISGKALSALGLIEAETGSPASDYLPPEVNKHLSGLISDSSLTEKTFELQLNHKKENIFFEFNLRKIYNANGKSDGYIIFFQEKDKSNDRNNTINNREKMYDILMQTSPEPMFIYDIENLRFLEVNPAALKVYGYTKNEFLQMDLTDLYAPEDIQTLLDTSNTRNKECVFTGPWRHKKHDGSTMFVEISKSAFDYNFKKAHFNIVRDVSEKIELENNIQLFKAAFENTSDLLFVTDKDGFILQANEAVLKLLGFKKEELTDRPFITLLSESSRSEVKGNIFSSKTANTTYFEIELKKSNNEFAKAGLKATPIINFESQIVSFSLTASPSIQNTAQVQIVQPPAVADPAVQRTSGGLDPQFLSSMFHEILTPINVILGFIQEITETIESPTDEQKEASDIINQNSKLLLQTMDSAVEYSHIEQNRIEIKPEKVIFTELVDEIQKSTKKLAESSQIEFGYGKISSSLVFESDKHRLESLLSMVISMAMRITKEKKLFLSAYQYDDENCIVTLKDNRSAISKYMLTNFSDIFLKEESQLKKDFGTSKLTTGLARRLLKLLSGRFEVVKKGGQEIEAGFVFPLVFTKAQEPPALSVKPVETKPVAQIVEKEVPLKKMFEPQVLNEEKSLQNIYKEEYPLPTVVPEMALSIEKPQKSFEEPQPKPLVKAEPKPMQKPAPVYRTEESDNNAEEEKNSIVRPSPVVKSISNKADLSKLKCLYVEDQVDSQILFKVQMKELKKIDFAVSFEAALPLLEHNKYDFIVMDINLQGEYNGLDALRIIRKLPGYEKTHVFAVTAYVLSGDKEKFIAAGFDDFISKPILREKLIEVVEKYL